MKGAGKSRTAGSSQQALQLEMPLSKGGVYHPEDGDGLSWGTVAPPAELDALAKEKNVWVADTFSDPAAYEAIAYTLQQNPPFKETVIIRPEAWQNERLLMVNGDRALGVYGESLHEVVIRQPQDLPDFGMLEARGGTVLRDGLARVVTHELAHHRLRTEVSFADRDWIAEQFTRVQRAWGESGKKLTWQERMARGIPYYLTNKDEMFAEAYANWRFPKGAVLGQAVWHDSEIEARLKKWFG